MSGAAQAALANLPRRFMDGLGKSLDLIWLANQGFQVLGIELAEKAVEDFFREHNLEPQLSQRGGFKVYAHGPIQLWCGDFFALTVIKNRGRQRDGAANRG